MKCIHINLLKLFVLLFGVSNALPAKIRGLNWFTNYIVDASEDVEYNATIQTTSLPASPTPPPSVQANESAVTLAASPSTPSTPAATPNDPTLNFSDSIIRAGIRHPSVAEQELQKSGILANASGGSSQQQLKSDKLSYYNDRVPQRRQDDFGSGPSAQPPDGSEANASTTTIAQNNHRSHYGGASNHRNYPIEPYPSASYTNLATYQAPSATIASNSSPIAATSAQASSVSSLLNRDHHHHHSFNLSELGVANHRSALFASSSSPATTKVGGLHSSHDDAQSAYAQILNHNYGSSFQAGQQAPGGQENALASSTALNANLIQNLTAGLFPLSKLSNGTLFTLNELLNKTKQHTLGNGIQQPQASGATFTNGYRPNYGTQMHNQATNNYLEALLSDQRFNSMLDYLTTTNSNAPPSHQQTSQFGFREPSSMARFQSPASSSLGRPQVTASQKMQTGKPWNVYNTYLPSRDQMLNQGSKPAATNGQALNMAAATLYDNYLNQNYRQNSNLLMQQQASEAQQLSNMMNNQYQFVQQHQANNQNHLDKVVYHSTPFRPSIVSPPSAQILQNSSSSQVILSGFQRPKTEADVKSVLHAPLQNSSSTTMPGMRTPMQNFRLNQVRFAPGSQSSSGVKSNFEPNIKHEDYDLAFDQLAGNTNNLVMNQPQRANISSPKSPDQQQQHRQTSATSQQATKQQHQHQHQQRAQPTSSASGASGQQLLLDLYERAIDQQIQEAIYGDHQQHFAHFTAASSAGPQQAPIASAPSTSSNSNWHYDEGSSLASYDPSLSTLPMLSSSSGLRPTTSMFPSATLSGQVALGRTPSLPYSHSQGAYLPSSFQSALDPLTSALQELPTFSASDLQPIIPTGFSSPGGSSSETGSYSLLPPIGTHHQHHQEVTSSHQPPMLADQSMATSDASSLAALASQLFSGATTVHGPHSPSLVPQSSPASQAALLSQLLNNEQGELAPLTSYGQSSPSASHHTSSNSNNHATTAGLAAILTKLQTGSQLASLLTSPLAHLYANLPRYRHAKTKQHANQVQKDTQTAQASSISPMASQLIRQQAAATLATQRAAALIANAGHSLTPLQEALLQAQFAAGAYLQADPLLTEHSMPATTLPTPSNNDSGQQAAHLGLASLAPGLAGGGVSPLIWRNIFARKQQTLSGQNNGTTPAGALPLFSSAASNSIVHVNSQRSHTKSPLSNQGTKLLSSLWAPDGSGLLGSVAPLAMSASSNANIQQASPLASLLNGVAYELQRNKKPARLKIKMVKIPVAFYDVLGGAPSGHMLTSTSQEQPLDASTSLLSFHTQPSQTSSLLASLSCPFHNHHNYNQLSSIIPQGPNQMYATLGTGDDFLTLNQQADQQQQQKPTLPVPSSQPAPPATTTPTQEPNKSPPPIRDFTDINQPQDLQVSPSSGSSGGAGSGMMSNEQQQLLLQHFGTSKF